MIISRTPLRISFVGGGSDLSAFYRTQPGAVVSTAINKYIYITMNKKFDHKIRASYSVTEIVDNVDELKHDLIREAVHLVGLDGGVEITSISDIPSQGTGLGSSSTYTVGLLRVLHAYLGQRVEVEQLAREACKIEIDICGKPIGKQDQYIAAYGGFQYIQFDPDGSASVTPIACSQEAKKELQSRLLLLYTGVTRSANDILAEQTYNIKNDEDKLESQRRIAELARQLRDVLAASDLGSFGELLHESWLQKKKMASGVSNSRIDRWYELARAQGAIGGKITGAGGGGFLLLYAPPERHHQIKQALPELRPVAFCFESQGSNIVYNDEV